jgi:hypothetical protein
MASATGVRKVGRALGRAGENQKKSEYYQLECAHCGDKVVGLLQGLSDDSQLGRTTLESESESECRKERPQSLLISVCVRVKGWGYTRFLPGTPRLLVHGHCIRLLGCQEVRHLF